MNINPLINPEGDNCVQCGQPTVRNFGSFDTLPLVEFMPDGNLPEKKVMDALRMDPPEDGMMAAPVKKQNKRNTGPDGWNQNDGDEQTLQIDHGEDLGNDLFSQKVLEFTDNQTTPEQYRPVVVDEHILKSMRFEEVYVLDLSHFSKAMPKRYFKNMSPEIAIMKCENCCKFFI